MLLIDFVFNYLKYILLTVFFIFVYHFTLKAETNATINGYVFDSKNKPIPSVRVAIPSLKKQTFTDAKGFFNLKDVNTQTLLVTFSRIGYLAKDTLITVSTTSEYFIYLDESDIITSDIVVTGTRTYKHIENLPMPIEVVSSSQIKDKAYLRLDEVLSQEMGIPMTENRGRGMQIQGMDADYTLVLLNGEPMSNRTGGVFNISRFSIGNLSRIEVVRGPSSSLYGSSALAGVVNLITEKPTKPLDIGLSARYGTHHTYDVAGEVNASLFNKKLGIRTFIDNYRTEGFSLIPSVIEKIVPENNNWTINTELFYDIASTVRARLNGRHNSEQIGNSYKIIEGNNENIINTTVTNIENNASININHSISNRYDLDIRLYGSDYLTKTLDVFNRTEEIYDSYKFRHRIGKAELQSTALMGLHQVTGGFGLQLDEVESGQIDNGVKGTQLYFAYLQDDWQLSDKLNLIGSLRYDGHNDYADNLSPKIAMSWSVIPDLILRASVGSGFKAPTFEQLYLNWSLASEGYSVFGIKNFKTEFNKLGSTGQLSDTLINLDKIIDLTPELSWAIDLGGTLSLSDNFELKLNIFRNNVNGLIEFLPVAIKSNGRLLYTYFNLNRIYTQGLETRLRYVPIKNLNLQVHYQLLYSGDLDVIDILNSENQTQYWKRDGIRDRRVRPNEYGGLFNRSRHSGTFNVDYNFEALDMILSLRGVYKSKYGYADRNGNTILDDASEYSDGYSLWHFLLTQNVFEQFRIHFGVNNIFDYKTQDTRLVTSGRTLFLGITYNYTIY